MLIIQIEVIRLALYESRLIVALSHLSRSHCLKDTIVKYLVGVARTVMVGDKSVDNKH
jgi:hypothetical protein